MTTDIANTAEITHLVMDTTPILLSTVLAALTLCRGPPLLLDLEQRPIGMSTTRHTMPFDASRAGELLVVDENHGVCRNSLHDPAKPNYRVGGQQ
jgi:hypothetical protein